MAWALVQQASNAEDTVSTSITATFGATPTADNLMVATFFTKSDTAPTNPSGWSQAISVTNATNNDYIRICYKIVVADGTGVTFTGMDTFSEKLIGIFEFSGNATSTPLDKTASTGITTGVTTLASGTTATLSATGEMAIAVWGLRANISSPSVNNSYTLQHDLTTGAGGIARLLDAYKLEVGTAAQSVTASWTTSADTMAAIATFLAPAAAGGQPTVKRAGGIPFMHKLGGAHGGGGPACWLKRRRPKYVLLGA